MRIELSCSENERLGSLGSVGQHFARVLREETVTDRSRACIVAQNRDIMNEYRLSDIQIGELKKAIRQELKSPIFVTVLHEALQQRDGRDVTGIIDQLNSQGMMSKMVEQAMGKPAQSTPSSTTQPNAHITEGRRCLKVDILHGKAFTDYLSRDPEPGESLSIEGELFGQRFSSTSCAAAVEPKFKCEALIELPILSKGNGGSEALQLLSIRQPMHLLVIQTNAASAKRRVVAIGNAEWRAVLVRSGSVTISVQLATGPAGLSAGLPSAPSGVIVLKLSITPNLFPALGTSTLPQHLDGALLASQQKAENARDAESMGRFLSEARNWYARYLSLSPPGPQGFKSRPIKVLARCEDGVQYPVCSYIAPLRLGRFLPSPRSAARFVSLLHRREEEEEAHSLSLTGLGGGQGFGVGESSSCWCLLHTILSLGCASKEEAALLLCGLLLGFGLDAWCIVGRLKNGEGHTWVMTRGPMAEVRFWEPASGQTYGIEDAQSWPYQSIGCVFNDRCVAANLQSSSIGSESYLIEDPRAWSIFEVLRSDVPGPSWVPLTLTAPLSDSDRRIEQEIEREVKELLLQHRKEVGIKWDSSLDHLLMQALESYEIEATQEQQMSSELFQQSIRRSVPSGWQFQAFPVHVRNVDSAQRAVESLLEEKAVLDILSISGCREEFALSMRIFQYPEGLNSCWLMLAVRFERRRS